MTAGQAGTDLTCTCGKTVTVPRLSQLRTQAGETAGGASPELVILCTYANDQQPVGGNACLSCGTTTTNRVACSIEYEKPWVKKEGTGLDRILAFVLFGLLGWLYFRIGRRERRVFGEHKLFKVSVTLCPACEGPRLKPLELREILRNEPQFDRLFEKYPEAKVSIDPVQNVRELDG